MKGTVMVNNSTNINSVNTKMTMLLEIHIMAWDRHKNMAVVKPVNGIPASPLEYR
jgi:hypothetical protein